MGGCATKLKVLMADGGETPAPAPLPKEEALVDAKEGEVVEELKKVDRDIVVDASKEVVDDEKRQSLSTLFKENEGKDSTALDNTPSEPVKQEETQVDQKPKEAIEVPIESNEAEKAVEVAPATGASDKKATESLAVTETPKLEKNTAEEKTVTETKGTETSAEKQVVEVESATVNSKSEAKEENKVENPATLAQKPETPEVKKVEEKDTSKEPDVTKGVEEKPAAVTPKPETPKEEKKVENPATTVTKGVK